MKTVIIGLLLFFTALAIVYFKHSNRQLLIELHAMQAERDELNSEWSQLLLEESTLVMHSRVEHVATQALDMQAPRDEEVIWVQGK
ncbi:MAG TPA: cell division protein FtsL [Gammaproteobacteria bacterium]|nr:cell division protein FtsL [Gammaproteobacteria bacterium]